MRNSSSGAARIGVLSGLVLALLMVFGGAAQAAPAPAAAPAAVVLVSGGFGDDAKDVGKCAWNGTKAGMGPWKVLKKLRKHTRPELTDLWSVPPNPWVAGGTIIACSVFSARPAY
jgi:hypothetical protein